MTYAREEATGIVFVPSMALGVLITAPFVTVGLILAGHAPWRLYTKASAIPGILAGCLWNAGNVGPLVTSEICPYLCLPCLGLLSRNVALLTGVDHIGSAWEGRSLTSCLLWCRCAQSWQPKTPMLAWPLPIQSCRSAKRPSHTSCAAPFQIPHVPLCSPQHACISSTCTVQDLVTGISYGWLPVIS